MKLPWSLLKAKVGQEEFSRRSSLSGVKLEEAYEEATSQLAPEHSWGSLACPSFSPLWTVVDAHFGEASPLPGKVVGKVGASKVASGKFP